jgi:hypothetical protein
MGNQYPKSIKEAVGLLSSELSEKDKQAIRNIPSKNFPCFISTWAIMSGMNLDYGAIMRNF